MQKKNSFTRWGAFMLGATILSSFMLLTVGPIAAETGQPVSQPDIKFVKKTYDFGTVQKGDKVPHIFKFKNVGQSLLKISGVKTSCGCTVPKNFTKEIQPGEEGQIEVTFNSTNFMGAIHKTIYVSSNDPDEPKVSLSLKGTVTADVIIQPPRNLFFGLVQMGQASTKSIMVKQAGSKELKVLKVEADLPFLSAKIIPKPRGNHNNYQIEVTVAADAPEGLFRGKLKIHTNIEKYRLIEHSVIGTVKSTVAAPKPKR